MFTVGILTCFIIVFVVAKFYKLEELGVASAIFGGILGIAAILVFLGASATQMSDIESYKKCDNLKIVYAKRSELLTKQFAGYLKEFYPQFEKDIYKTIRPSKIDVYFVKYPELQSSATIKELVVQVRELEDAKYSQEIQKVELMRDMRFRKINPWFLSCIIPEPLKEIKED